MYIDDIKFCKKKKDELENLNGEVRIQDIGMEFSVKNAPC